MDAVITSPPYSSTEFYYGEKPSEFWEKLAEKTGRKAWLNANSKTRRTITEKEKPLSPDNIGNLPLGGISTIITSPPYAEANRGGGIAVKGYEGIYGKDEKLPLRHDRPLSDNPDNISNLPYVDCIVTSPPYADAKKGEVDLETAKKIAEKKTTHYSSGNFLTPGRVIGLKALQSGYSENKDNIGNLPLGEISAIITSPPYENQLHDSAEKRAAGAWNGSELDVEKNLPVGYSENPDNIGNLKSSEEEYRKLVDAVITSPPYEGSLEGTSRHTRGGIASRDPALAQTGSYATVMSFGVPVGYSPNPDNIGNLKSSDKEYEELDETIKRLRKFGRTDPKAGGPYGRSLAHSYSPNPENIGNLKSSDEEYQALVDAVITSPPYAHESTASKPTNLEKQGLFKMGHSKEEPYTEEDYREWDKHKEGNIAKRKLFIRVPCSPEEAQFHDTRPGRKGTIWEWTKEVEATPEVIEQIQKLKSEKKGKSETYLEAMLKVYGEMFRVLKPGGLAIVVVKPFVRNKKVVDLPYHTWILMTKVGFRLAKLHKLRLFRLSFWRILQYRKHPDVPIIAHEYVLVCQKPGSEHGESVEPQIDPLLFMAETAAKKQAPKLLKSAHVD